MIADIVGLNVSLITIAGVIWGAMWKFFLEKKVTQHNDKIKKVKTEILKKFGKEYQTAKEDKKILLLQKTAGMINIAEEKSINAGQTNAYVIVSIIANLGSITIKFVENGDFSQYYAATTFLSLIFLFVFAISIYRTNQKISQFENIESGMKKIEKDVEDDL